MAWFRNHYNCDRCNCSWEDEWSCICDDECPACGRGSFSPYDSDDLSTFFEKDTDGNFVIYYSDKLASNSPKYVRFASIRNMELADFLLQLASTFTWEDALKSTKVFDGDSWLEDVTECVLSLGKVEFFLTDVYKFEPELSKKYTGNRHIREKIRQQLQRLRDSDKIEFLGGGKYRLK